MKKGGMEEGSGGGVGDAVAYPELVSRGVSKSRKRG